MSPDFAKKLDLQIYETKVNTQKIDDSKLDTFDIVVVSFLVKNKKRKFCFFEEIFLLADINIDIALDILFFTLKNIEINIVDHHL